MPQSELIESNQTIKIVCNDDACVTMWKVGEGEVEKIECYGEPSDYTLIPFLKIWKNGKVAERANALRFRIVYE